MTGSGECCCAMGTAVSIAQIVILNLLIAMFIATSGMLERVTDSLLHDDAIQSSTSWWPWWPAFLRSDIPSPSIDTAMMKTIFITLNVIANFGLWIGLKKKMESSMKYLLLTWLAMIAMNGTVVFLAMCFDFVEYLHNKVPSFVGVLFGLILPGISVFVGMIYNIWLMYILQLHRLFFTEQETTTSTQLETNDAHNSDSSFDSLHDDEEDVGIIHDEQISDSQKLLNLLLPLHQKNAIHF